MVMLSGYDLWRLQRALGVPWDDLVTVGVAFGDGFRLDGGPTRYGFRLKQKPSGACTFLVELPGGHSRCGVRGTMPAACRVYPYHVNLVEEWYDVYFGGNAVCPPAEAYQWKQRAPSVLPQLDEEVGERALYQRVLARWDTRVEAPVEAEAFVRFTARVYEAIEPLRRGERGEWQPAAYQLVDAS
jgi:hypothetical protein